MKTISTLQFDVLKEMANIGSGHAATSLSLLLGTKIDMRVPAVSLIEFNEMVEAVGGAEQRVTVIALRIEGDASGTMFVILGEDQTHRLLETLLQTTEVSQGTFSTLEASALQEIGNILCGSYLAALANLTKLNLQPSIPAMRSDMAGALLSEGLIAYGIYGDQALLIDTVLLQERDAVSEPMQCHFFLIPDPDHFKRLFEAVGVR
ncbi:MAG: chemotaxis protein CheC [Bacilli bacterium]